MKIKAGTPCFISEKRKDNKIYPITDGGGKSHFSIDQEVEIKNWNCGNQNLVAVQIQANSVASIVAHDEIETIVWVNKFHI